MNPDHEQYRDVPNHLLSQNLEHSNPPPPPPPPSSGPDDDDQDDGDTGGGVNIDVGDIIDDVVDVVGDVVDVVDDVVGDVVDATGDIVGDVVNLVDDVTDDAGGVATDVVDVVGSLIPEVLDTVEQVADGVGDGGGLLDIGGILGGDGEGSGIGSLINLDGDDDDALINIPLNDGEGGGLLGVGSILDSDGEGSGIGGLINIGASAGTGDDTGAAINLDLSGGLLGSGDGDGSLLNLHEDGGALINVPILEGEGTGTAGGEVGSLLNAAMLDAGSGIGLNLDPGDGTYDGNVALAGDLSSALGSTLDILTTSSSLFDVPALDFLVGDGLDG